MTPNYSIYSLPAFWFVAVMPHMYAVATMKKANNNYWNNTNPRSVDTLSKYQKAVPAAVYAAYERGKAAHNNGLENFPLFIGAILAGNMAKLAPSTLNNSAVAVIGLRLAYNWAYISITSNKLSYVRSVIWAASLCFIMRLYVLAGNELAANY